LVEATAISGPANICKTSSLSLHIVLPFTLTTPKVFAPSFFATLREAIVSAVSPDCETRITSEFLLKFGFSYLNSDAISVLTGISSKSVRI